LTRRLGRAFFARPASEVAAGLIGCTLVVDAGTADKVRAVIVEVEAYLGLQDPASHAFRGPTPRAAIMFGEPGHLYVYLSYGVHHCANLVTQPRGDAGAVLLRSAMVIEGEVVVRTRRAAASRGRVLGSADLLRGPGNLCSGLGLQLADNGLDICHPGRLWVMPRSDVPPLATGPRIGITVAREAAHRYWWDGHSAVSRARPQAPE
jgi:DNA-3-methyladenine glycosylase